MIECGPGTTVYVPSITKTRSHITVLASDSDICKTLTTASALETVVSHSEIIISGRAVWNPLICRDLRSAANNHFRYGNDYLHAGNDGLRTANDRRCSIHDRVHWRNGCLRYGNDRGCCANDRCRGGEDRVVGRPDRRWNGNCFFASANGYGRHGDNRPGKGVDRHQDVVEREDGKTSETVKSRCPAIIREIAKS
jgi:hypothetical protein